ncbi:DinB family protein [Flectobacillus sp. BAB-3569]|uniref:DinB family protein n=1 Tax=Flectobacillus sp. BAB-3569 TaxID=1509483 RepID=UPI000BA2CDF2|nr:DinB family protein [Flectobacillus sp. BAB-3569]PAC33225.1 DinB superfamily protein [Flectobacillus sp. BAB-3569]
MNVIPILIQLFERDLQKLKAEIVQYSQEENIWAIVPEINNSAGNLVLHLVGNLNTYIGAEIGKTGYIRNRPLEFSQKGLSKKELVNKISDTLDVIKESLNNLPEEALEEIYPQLVFEQKTSTGYLLTHLTTHLTYHLGQINYHRRLLDKA